MKPGSRAEFEWSEVPYPATLQGQAETDPHAAPEHPVAVLWVPDPEQRRGRRRNEDCDCAVRVILVGEARA